MRGQGRSSKVWRTSVEIVFVYTTVVVTVVAVSVVVATVVVVDGGCAAATL